MRKVGPAAFISPDIEAYAADLTVGVAYTQVVLSTPFADRRTSGSTSGWSIAGTTGDIATPSSGMCM